MRPTPPAKDGTKLRRGVTLAELMIFVALLAVIGSLAIYVFAIVRAMDDTYYPAQKKVVKTWDVKASPKVEVDLFEGYISVAQSQDGKVSAVLTPFAVTMVSQAAADAALGDIAISAIQEGGTIRIKTTKTP